MRLLNFFYDTSGFSLLHLHDHEHLINQNLSPTEYSSIPSGIIVKPLIERHPLLTDNLLKSSNGSTIPAVVTRMLLNEEYLRPTTNFYATNNRYYSVYKLIEDPCKYTIRDGLIEEKVDLDICENKLRMNKVERSFKRTKNRYDFIGEPVRYEKNKETEQESDRYGLKVFVFNGPKRFVRLGEKIAKETKQVLEEVSSLFERSKMPVSIKFTGMLNFVHNIITKDADILFAFKKATMHIRFHPRNLRLPLGQADVVVYLEDADLEQPRRTLVTHGQSFYGGAAELSRSYAVVLTEPGESNKFIAKKVAHEVAHLLGAVHDKQSGFLMEAVSCAGCENQERLFSEETVRKVGKFMKFYKEVFSDKAFPLDKTGPIISKNSAREFIKKHRKHSFQDIVESRLHGISPENSSSLLYLVVSLGVYIICVSLAIYYLS